MALICHCHGVNDRTIAATVAAGARSLDDVQVGCGAASSCGQCEAGVARVLSSALAGLLIGASSSRG